MAREKATTPKKTPLKKKSLKITCKFLLSHPIKGLGSHSTKRDKNSDYKGRLINLEDVKLWEDFITMNDIEAIWEESTKLNAAMCRKLTQEELRRVMIDEPVSGANRNEMEFESRWRARAHSRINLINFICAKELQNTETPIFPLMGDGESATWISDKAEKNAEHKKPDHAGFLYGPDDSQYYDDGPSRIFNRIPGDAKLFRKIRRNMLPPDGEKYEQGVYHKEAQRVLSQIHGYMDRHEARYGYIVNNEELIFVRRRDTGWGQIDISPAIPHPREPDPEADSDDEDTITSLYVLYYFHWKVALDDSPSGWRLRSFGREATPTPEPSAPPAGQVTGTEASRLATKGVAKKFGLKPKGRAVPTTAAEEKKTRVRSISWDITGSEDE